jgi:hypothetical protein
MRCNEGLGRQRALLAVCVQHDSIEDVKQQVQELVRILLRIATE